MPFVVVEVAPADVPVELAQKLVEACSAAVIEGECALSGLRDSADADAVAIVRWENADGDGKERRARIQVGVSGSKPPRWETTVLEFREVDARAERFRAVGLTIATLAGQLLRARDEEAAPAAEGNEGSESASPVKVGAALAATARATGSTSPLPPGRPSRERNERAFWMSGGALGGPGLAEGAPRVGAFLGITWRPTGLPFTGVASASYAARLGAEGDVTVRFAELGAGVGALLLVGPDLLAEGRLEGVLRVLEVEASRGGRADSGGSTVLGAAVEGRLGLRGGVLWPFAGLRATKGSTETGIHVEDRRVGTVTAWSLTGELGVAWGPP